MHFRLHAGNRGNDNLRRELVWPCTHIESLHTHIFRYITLPLVSFGCFLGMMDGPYSQPEIRERAEEDRKEFINFASSLCNQSERRDLIARMPKRRDSSWCVSATTWAWMTASRAARISSLSISFPLRF